MASSSESVEGLFAPQVSNNDSGVAYNVYAESEQQPIEGPEKHVPTWRKYVRQLRPDWILDHKDYNSFKLMLPTFFQVWTTVFISVIPATSHWVGNAAYLFQIIGFICASGGLLVSINIVLSVVCLVWALVGWLFAIVALAITTKIRGWPTVESILNELIAEGTCTAANIEVCMINEFYTGRYLQTKCSVIFAIAIVIGVAVLGMTQYIHPMARFPYVTGIIALLINCCYTVFYPVFIPKRIGMVVFTPLGFSLIMKIFASIVVFPFTSSCKYVGGLSGAIANLQQIWKRNETFFNSMKPSVDSFANYKNLLADIEKLRLKVTPLEIFLSSSRIEISYGRFGSGDGVDLRAKIKPLLTTVAGYEYFYLLIQERKQVATQVSRVQRRGSLSSAQYPSSTLFSSFGKIYSKVGVFEDSQKKKMLLSRFSDGNKEDNITPHDLDVIANVIKKRNSKFPGAVTKVLGAIHDWMEAANDFRSWSIFTHKAHAEKQEQQHELLLKARADFEEILDLMAKEAEKTKSEYDNIFESDEKTLCLISQSSLFQYLSNEVGHQVLSLIDLLLSIDERTPRPRFFTILDNFTHGKHPRIFNELMGEDPTPQSAGKLQQFTRKRDPDSLDATTPIQLVMTYVKLLFRSMQNEHVWFWIRCGILTGVCCVPYLCRTSGSWYFKERLIWLPVTCAVSTAEFTAETIYQFVCKVVYSFLGLLGGLVAWYISAGSGSGNYYGYCVVTAFVYFFLSYYRHFAVHAKIIPNIMTCVTPTLVLGTSWVDGNYGKLGNIGYGWRVAVTRLVSVIIGLSVALLASTFPKPKSSKVAVRKSLANALEQACNLQCKISDFAMLRFEDPSVHQPARHDAIADEIREVLFALAHVRAMMRDVQYEIPFSGAWPTEKYEQLHSLTTDIVQIYFLFYRLINHVQDTEEWIPHMIDRAGWNEPTLVADMFSLIFMSSEALRLKSGIPEITNATLSLKHLELLQTQWGTTRIALAERIYYDEKSSSTSDNESQLRRRELKSINYDKLSGHDGQLNIVSLLFMHMIYIRVDQAVLVVKGLVGEKYNYNTKLFDF